MPSVKAPTRAPGSRTVTPQGGLTGVEMRGPDFRGFSEDGNKSLFRFQPGQDAPTRLAVVEAPIDAMSMAALEGMRRDTLYIATGGGMGPGTVADLEREMASSGLAGRHAYGRNR